MKIILIGYTKEKSKKNFNGGVFELQKKPFRNNNGVNSFVNETTLKMKNEGTTKAYTKNKKLIIDSFQPTNAFKETKKRAESLGMTSKGFKNEHSVKNFDTSEHLTSEDAFLECINGYIHELRKGKSLEIRKNKDSKYITSFHRTFKEE